MVRNLIDKLIIKEYKFKYLIFAVVSGVLLGLSFQRCNIFLFAWIAFIPLIYCVYKNNFKYSILCGFITGIIYSLIAFNWMYLFLVENTKNIFDSIIISIIVWLYFSIYFSIWCGLFNYIKKLNKCIVIVFISALWVVLEYIRNYFISGFPINLLGYSQSSFTTIIQIADMFSVYIISFFIILINVCLFYYLNNKKNIYLGISLLIFFSLFLYGTIRINEISNIQSQEEINVGIIQPNISQHKKWHKKYLNRTLSILKHNIQHFKDKNIDIILFPETVLPGYLNEEPKLQNFIKDISNYSTNILIGGMDKEKDKIYNCVFVISKTGEIIGKYKKKHLIIFGEYIPFKGFLSKIFSKMFSNNNFTKEIELKVFKFDKYILGINICSENYYPYLSRELVLKGATLLTTHSNDAWCDGLSYPYQHFILNIFRAIENRKYLVVASNTGISSVISPTGKVIKQTKNQEQICFEEKVYTNNYITIYDKIGDLFVYICLIFVVIILLYVPIKNKLKIFN